MIAEQAIHKAVWTIEKYADDEAYRRREAFERVDFEGNVLLNEGISRLHNLLVGGGGNAFSNGLAFLGVGDTATPAADPAQTGLQAASNKLYKAMDTGYPQYATQVSTWQSVFGASDANWAWAEFTVANGNSDAADNLNRKVSAQGTKTSGQTWTLKLQITWS